MPPGCRFQGRCPQRIERCATLPPLVAVDEARQHHVRCWVNAAPKPGEWLAPNPGFSGPPEDES